MEYILGIISFVFIAYITVKTFDKFKDEFKEEIKEEIKSELNIDRHC